MQKKELFASKVEQYKSRVYPWFHGVQVVEEEEEALLVVFPVLFFLFLLKAGHNSLTLYFAREREGHAG